jgi:hypothetical protein
MEFLKRCDVCGSENIKTKDSGISLCACQGCGFIFHNPRPTADDIVKFYSDGRRRGYRTIPVVRQAQF